MNILHSRKLRIALLAPVEEQVPPKKYGGTELVVYNLAKRLVEMGHHVTLLASGDSVTDARLIPIFPEAIRTLPKSRNPEIRRTLTLVGIGRMLEYLSEHRFDLIHNHVGWTFLPFTAALHTPTVTTLHGYLGNPDESEMYRQYAKENYVSISMNQRMSTPHAINFVDNVYNGIDVSRFGFFPEPREYYAFLARMSPEKGPLEAIAIARAAGVDLIMAGKIDPTETDYFEERIKPLIDGKQIRFIGEIGHEDKVKLLGNAKALIAPIQWDEPFGLYFIEAMACGTPVITNRRGSVPEIIIDGKTGYIVESVEEAAAMTREIRKLNRWECREHVRKNFSDRSMAENYVAAYLKVLDMKSHPISSPADIMRKASESIRRDYVPSPAGTGVGSAFPELLGDMTGFGNRLGDEVPEA